MKPMDQDYIEKHDIAQRYLQGRLTPEESEAYECYLMEHPDAVEILELDIALKQGLELGQSPKAKENMPINWFNLIWLKYAIAPVFAFALGVFGSSWILSKSDGVNNVYSNTQIVSLDVTRGNDSSSIQKFSILPTSDNLVFILPTDFFVSTPVEVSLKQIKTEEFLFYDKTYFTDEQGNVNISWPTDGLYEGSMTFTVYKAGKLYRSYEFSFIHIKK